MFTNRSAKSNNYEKHLEKVFEITFLQLELCRSTEKRIETCIPNTNPNCKVAFYHYSPTQQNTKQHQGSLKASKTIDLATWVLLVIILNGFH